ncbi:MAG: hypothetical protein K1X95_03755 [Acidimicrobiia bacterium]|nr:hypothetical protein [Acidimicrobiia bacterium]
MCRRRSLIPLLAVTAALLAACGSGSDVAEGACAPGWPTTIVVGDAQFTPVVVSADLGVGPTEFTLGLLDRDQNSIGGPDTAVDVRFFDLDRSQTEPAGGGPASFFWAIPDVRGMYSAPVDLDAAGTWGAEVSVHRPGAAPMCEKVRFSVQEQPQAPAVGAAAPHSDTRTAADAVGGNLATITSDPNPDPSLYRYSVAELLDAHRPFVVAFATPKFCTSRTCGPTVDQIKQVAATHPNCTYVHVEIFEDLDSPVPKKYVPAVTEWNLPSEPWVFAVGADGRVAARFEGAMSDQSLRDAVEAVCPEAAG